METITYTSFRRFKSYDDQKWYDECQSTDFILHYFVINETSLSCCIDTNLKTQLILYATVTVVSIIIVLMGIILVLGLVFVYLISKKSTRTKNTTNQWTRYGTVECIYY